MSVKKTIYCGLIIMGGISMAHANDLHLMNNTNRDSTCFINDKMCSNKLGEGGITRAHKPNTISDLTVKIACTGHQSNCKADVYMTDNCSGEKIATVILDTSKGIQSVTMNTTEYQISGSGFNISLDGGPALLRK